jgi:hypothetical protein
MTDNSEYNLGFEDGLALGADRIEALQAEIERLTFDGIHTCHDDCPRLPCVQRREIERLREALGRIAAITPEGWIEDARWIARAALSESML